MLVKPNILQSRQLLSYSLIHPAFDNRERNRLTQWMAGLDNPRVQPVEISPEVSSGKIRLLVF